MRRRGFVTAALCLVPSAFLAFQQPRDTARATAKGTAEISATLVTDDTEGRPVRRATIALVGADINPIRLMAVTDDAGRFGFTSLPAGRYSLSATKAGYLPAAYGAKRAGGPGTAIVVEDGQHLTGLTMTLLRGSVLTGTVFDASGQPAPDVAVSVLRYAVSYQTGERTLQPVVGSSGQTDDRGVYRLYSLAPGEYLLAAQPLMRPNGDSRANGDIHQTTNADVQRAQQQLRDTGGATPAITLGQSTSVRAPGATLAYAPVYHPAAVAPADATTITLGPHEERAGIDVLLRFVTTARVEGVIRGPDGLPRSGVSLTMSDVNPQPAMMMMRSGRSASSDRDGKFLFQGVTPGRYVITARGAGGPVSGRGGAAPQGPGPMLWATAEVTVDGQDTQASLTLAPGMTVSGRLVFEGTLARPADLAQVRPSLSASQTAQGMAFMSPFGHVDANGSFRFTDLMPGKYRLGVSVPGSTATTGWALRSAIANGADILDVPLDVQPDENVDGLVVTLTDRRTEISGTLQDAGGRPAPQYTIVVFSADKRFWLPQSRRTQQVRPAADGAFVVRNLPPGAYLIAALTDVEEGQWNDPAFLAQLAASGPVPITLAEGETKVQDLKIGGGHE